MGLPSTMMLGGLILAALAYASLSAADEPVLVPQVEGDWWQVAGDPDLGDLTDPKQQPVDFAVWQAADGTWQLWSCIRHTKCGGNTRLLYGWEGQSLTSPDWEPQGIKMQADPQYGETPGGLQAPHVIRVGQGYRMLYGDWESICLATSEDGKTFKRRVRGDGKTGMFTQGPGANTRDPMVLAVGSTYYCYYTAYPYRLGAVYCRTSRDLAAWSDSTTVALGGSAGAGPTSAECPFVVRHKPSGYYYLFRTQRYGLDAQTSVYRSRDPLDFGINDDRYLVCRLPVAAPEIIEHEGQFYIASLLPSLKGIRMARLSWVPQAEAGAPPQVDTAQLRRELRRFVWEGCGMPQARCPLNARVVGTTEGEGFVIERLIYDSEPCSSVPAHLYLPKGVTGPVPAIVMTHGHGASKSAPHNQYAGQLYARAGLAVLIADPLGEEERDPEGRPGTRTHDRIAEEAQRLGRPVVGKMVWDTIRGIDYLATRPEIGPDRIGVAGHSLGAIVGMYVAALDERVRVALLAAMYFVAPRTEKFCTRGLYERIEERVDYPTLLSLSADRCATMLLVGDDDAICGGREVYANGFLPAFAATQERFGQLGAASRITKQVYPDAGHRPYFLSKEALLWLETHLDLPRMTEEEIRALRLVRFGDWAQAHGIQFEPLYATESHKAGFLAPDVGVSPVPPAYLACLSAEERRQPRFTAEGWLDCIRR